MRTYIFIFTISVLFICLYCNACVKASNPLKIGIISDTHYLSEKLMEEGSQSLRNYEKASGRLVSKIPEVLDSILAFYLNSEIDILLIPGDITKDGEKQSHLDFVEKLKPLRVRGIRIYVIPGNHDINIPKPLGYSQDTTYPVDNISDVEFADIYSDFGYATAINRDTASLSYVAELESDTWLVAIDASRYKEYKDRSISSGQISVQTEQWITDRMAEAQDNNKQLLGMMHYGLVEHLPLQSTLFPQYLVEDWQAFTSLFAQMGMKAIFTGHFHSNDISEYTTGGGDKIYDIETGTLSSFPFAYRIIELYEDRMNIQTRNIMSVSSDPNLAETSKEQLQALAGEHALAKVKQMGMTLPPSLIPLFKQLAGQLFVLHLKGDEEMTPELMAIIEQLYENFNLSETISIRDFQLDFPPSDNNVEIVF